MFSIEIGGANSAPYKSIDHVVWSDIPKFVVLTGINGSGKTQLLQVLAYKLARATHQQFSTLNSLPFSATGDAIEPDEVAYLSSTQNPFRLDATNIGSLSQAKQQLFQRLQPQNSAHDIEAHILRQRIERKFGVQIHSGNMSEEVFAKLPDDYIYMLEYSEVAAGLSHVFVGYQVRRAEKLMQGETEEKVLQELGTAPWEFVNDALGSSGFAYRIVPPENKLLKNYQVKIVPADGGAIMNFDDLSSGEKTILRTVLWFYNSKHNGIFPKIFLLDEPDAHLHPSMTRQFIDVLKNILVDQYGVRIVLTTHSPSTVALAPDEAVFIMTKDQPRIRRPSSKAEAIGLLTAGLVIVSPGTKFVLVEDESDAKFYSAIRDVLVDQGPSRDPMMLKAAPSLVFLPAAAGKGSAKTGGGKNSVQLWTDRFHEPPLAEMFRGVIDLDNGNASSERVQVLGRYSIENYQLDPFIVFGVLIAEKRAPQLSGISITPGDEHRLRHIPTSDLQKVVDYIATQIEPALGTLKPAETLPALVRLTSGAELTYRTWMLSRRGHDLLPIYRRVFGEQIITPPKLESSFRRVRVVPAELAELFMRLQDG